MSPCLLAYPNRTIGSESPADGCVVVVDVGLLAVVLVLLAGIVMVPVQEGRVIVLVAVVVRSMLELTERAARVVVGHVVVIVGVQLRIVGMLLLLRLVTHGVETAVEHARRT